MLPSDRDKKFIFVERLIRTVLKTTGCDVIRIGYVCKLPGVIISLIEDQGRPGKGGGELEQFRDFERMLGNKQKGVLNLQM